jgi:gustatory receptor
MRANGVQFNAYGLFPIDLSVITGITSSITTYLIVLIQFKFSEEQTNKNDPSYNPDGNNLQYSAS